MPVQRPSDSLATREVTRCFMTLRLPSVPTCPFCLSALRDDVLAFHRDLACCQPCLSAGHRMSRRWYARAVQLHLNAHFFGRLGLLFFRPVSGWPARTALCMALGLPDPGVSAMLRRHPWTPPDPAMHAYSERITREKLSKGAPPA